MSGNQYATINTQVQCKETLHTDAHMFLCQELIEEAPNAATDIMAQLYLKVGMKHWKGKGRAANKSEVNQLYFRYTFTPNHYRYLNTYQKNSILESHMFLKENIDGTIKRRTVEGGNKQMEFTSKEDSSSTTVSTEAVILSCTIHVEEKRGFAVIYIPNAFIQTRVENENQMAVIKIRGVLSDLLP